jgi:hypothetical protein
MDIVIIGIAVRLGRYMKQGCEYFVLVFWLLETGVKEVVIFSLLRRFSEMFVSC